MPHVMMVLPREPVHETGESLFTWTDEDQAVLEFRYRRRYQPHEERFADFVTYGLLGDEIDAQTIWRAVVTCNSLREFGRMRTDWLIEECDVLHTLKKVLKKA